MALVLFGGARALAYVNGRAAQVKLAPIPGGRLMREDAAQAFSRMHAAAQKEGIALQVNSAFRTMQEQEALYGAYEAGTGNLAARPGYSNHQGGIAVDIAVSGLPRTYAWLEQNGARFGFKRTVPSEAWHWEYRPTETGAKV